MNEIDDRVCLFYVSERLKEIFDMFKFVSNFLKSALSDQKPVLDILKEYDYEFPNLNFRTDQWIGYLKTKYNKDRGQKKRTGLVKI